MKLMVILYFMLSGIYAQNDDLLSGYSLLLSSKPQVNTDVKPSLEKPLIKDRYNTVIFVFMNGVNDLGILNFSISDINEMEMVGSTDKVAIVVEHNRIEKTKQGLKFGRGANTYFIDKDESNSPEIISRVIDYTPDGDMGSSSHLTISAKKVIKRFKPERFILIVWNHGNGYFGISYDDVSGNSMSVKDLASALSEIKKAYGRKIDVFAMDACLMQMAEVVAELYPYASFIVASEELVPGGGYPYDDLIRAIDSVSSARDAAISIVDVFYKAYSSDKMSIFGRYLDKDITLSAINTSEFNQFVSMLNKWVSMALKSKDFSVITSSGVKEKTFFFLKGFKEENANLSSYLSAESEGVMTRSADMVDYLENAKSRMGDLQLKTETDNLINFITSKLIIHHLAGDYQNADGFSYKSRTHGIAIYLPKLRYNSKRYEGLRFAEISLWDDFLRGYLSDSINSGESAGQYTEDRETDTKSDRSEENKINQSQTSNTGSKRVPELSSFRNETEDRISANSFESYSGNINTERKISSYTNIYSTAYISRKTMLPQEDNLIEKNKQDKKLSPSKKTSVSELAAEIKKTSTGRTSFTDRFIRDSKETASIVLAKSLEGVKKLKDIFFEDKEKKKNYEELLRKFEVEISSNMNIEFSKNIVEDIKLQNEFSKVDRNRTSKIVSYANSIIELDNILSKEYREEDLNILSNYLSNTLDRSKQICELGICVPPENLVEKMMKKNSKYAPAKITFTEMAIRKWEYIFSDENYIFDWAQARNVKVSSITWSDMSVKERNAAIDKIVKESLLRDTTSNIPLSYAPARSANLEKRNELSKAVENVSQELLKNGFLKSEELIAIKNKPLEEQAYILANFFDRSGIRDNSQFSRDVAIISSNRSSFINEVLDQNNRKMLSGYISSNIANELSKSKTSSALYRTLYSGKTPAIVIEQLNSSDSRSDSSRIIIDASIIEQYMRIKGYTVESLKDEKVKKEIVSYISPLVVKEMAALYVSSKNKDYSPDVREKYSSALLYQAKYVEENSAIKDIFKNVSGYSDYADRVMAVYRLYRTSDSTDDFIQTAGLRYYSNLPSASFAKAEMLSAVTKEIERRSKMSADERKKIDEYAIFEYSDISRLSPYEISNHASAFKTDALIKLQQKLLSEKNFANIYEKIISSL